MSTLFKHKPTIFFLNLASGPDGKAQEAVALLAGDEHEADAVEQSVQAVLRRVVAVQRGPGGVPAEAQGPDAQEDQGAPK